MERRKNEIRTNYNRLKEECESLVNLLNSLLDKHMDSMKLIDATSSEDILKNPQFFISESKRQYDAIQKILTLNLDLESFLSSYESASSLTEAGNGSSNSQLSLNADSEENVIVNEKVSIKKEELELSINAGSVNNETADEIRIKNEKMEDKAFEVITSEGVNEVNIIESESDKNVNEKPPIEDNTSNRFIPKTNIINYGIDDESSEFSDYFKEPSTSSKSESLSGKKANSDGSRSKSPKERASARKKNTSQISDSSESSETVTEKLSKRKLMSRQQRYVNDLKKPTMPDLSFQVVPKSSSEFYSATDSENDLQTDTDSTYKESYDYTVITKSQQLELYDKCIISHVISPSEFYVNKLNESHDEFKDLVERLEKFGNCFKQFTSMKEAKKDIGKYCMAYSTNWDSWNRAEVLKWNVKSNSKMENVKVQFVDYGDYEIVPYCNLRTLPHELCEKPKLAIKCHLAYLFAPNSTPSNPSWQWPKKSIDAIKEVLEGPNTIYNITYVENMRHSYAIDLEKLGNTDDERTVGNLLLKSDNAIEITTDNLVVNNSFIKQQLITVQGMAGIATHMDESEVMNTFCDNVEITESNKLEEAFTGYEARDEARTCKYAKKGSCYKGVKCKLDHEPLNPDGMTTDKQFAYMDALNSLPSPEIGQTLTVLITSVCTVQSFYGHIMSYNADGENLRQLMESLNDVNNKHPPLKVLPASGEIVIAKYCDGKWYRAKACDVISNNNVCELMVKVFFVDFGDVMDVGVKDLRQISERYLHLPFQAVRFHIHNIMPKKDCDVNKAIEYFERVYLYKKFKVGVIGSLSSLIEVSLTNSFNEDIGIQLIEAGYAEPKILSLLPLENGKFLVD